MEVHSRFPVIEDNLVTRRIAGETIIVPVRRGAGDLNCIFTLNETASRIWQMLGERANLADIARAIRDEFEVAAEEAERDVLAFVEELERAGLVRSPSPEVA